MLVLLLLLACWDALPSGAEPYVLATTSRLTTADGATIALHHHPAPGPPVLLVHGISSNHRYFDLDEDHNLASWLAARGHDVWMLDLRGHGDALYGGAGRGDQTRQFTGWTVDDYGRYDVDAAIRYIQAVTGAPQVDYVGHSMGGMVGAIYAVKHGEDALGAMVALGSPGSFSREDQHVGLAATGMAVGGGSLLWVETPALGAMAADLKGVLPRRMAELLYNPANYAPATVDAMLRRIASPLARSEMQHFARMLRDERFESWDRSVDYAAAMRSLTVPLLVIGSDGDHVVSTRAARALCDAVGGEHAFFLASGGSVAHDYGHLDYALGEHASEELFPRIEAWLRRR